MCFGGARGNVKCGIQWGSSIVRLRRSQASEARVRGLDAELERARREAENAAGELAAQSAVSERLCVCGCARWGCVCVCRRWKQQREAWDGARVWALSACVCGVCNCVCVGVCVGVPSFCRRTSPRFGLWGPSWAGHVTTRHRPPSGLNARRATWRLRARRVGDCVFKGFVYCRLYTRTHEKQVS